MGETGRKLGDIDWSSDTARHYRAHILAPWFAHWLHDKPMNQPEAVTFRTGSNVWKSYDKWPPTEGITTKKVYFRADGKLSWEPPTEQEASDSYISDPANLWPESFIVRPGHNFRLARDPPGALREAPKRR